MMDVVLVYDGDTPVHFIRQHNAYVGVKKILSPGCVDLMLITADWIQAFVYDKPVSLFSHLPIICKL